MVLFGFWEWVLARDRGVCDGTGSLGLFFFAFGLFAAIPHGFGTRERFEEV